MPSEHGSFDRLLSLIGDVVGLLDLVEFRHGLLDALQHAVPSDWVSLNDIGPRAEDLVVIARPEVDEDKVAVFAAHSHENPLISRYAETRDGRAYRFSDVTTPEALHRTKLYREFYGPLGIEHQMAFTLPASAERILGIALSRRDRDYSDEERDLVERARPFFIQSYRNAIAHTTLSANGRGLARLDARGLESLLSERGLTRRESEVVRATANGDSSGVVAQVLGISPRTVHKHLERAYRKLGVTSRAEAAALIASLPG